MQYERRSFSVSLFASTSHTEQMKAVCAEHGHMDPPDRRGRCWRCAEMIEERESPGHGRRQAEEKPSSASYLAELFDPNNAAARAITPFGEPSVLKQMALDAGYRDGMTEIRADLDALAESAFNRKPTSREAYRSYADRSIGRAMRNPSPAWTVDMANDVFGRETGE